jgi:hypothetical protein
MQILDHRPDWLVKILNKTANDEPLTREEQQHLVAHVIQLRMKLREYVMNFSVGISNTGAVLDNPTPPKVTIVDKPNGGK